jgi:hypothetical protein
MEAAIYFYYATKECTPTKMSCGEWNDDNTLGLVVVHEYLVIITNVSTNYFFWSIGIKVVMCICGVSKIPMACLIHTHFVSSMAYPSGRELWNSPPVSLKGSSSIHLASHFLRNVSSCIKSFHGFQLPFSIWYPVLIKKNYLSSLKEGIDRGWKETWRHGDFKEKL